MIPAQIYKDVWPQVGIKSTVYTNVAHLVAEC